MRRAERARLAAQHELLRERRVALLRGDAPAGGHALEHIGLPLLRALQAPVGPQPRGRLRDAREQRRLGQAQVFRSFAEVAPARGLNADEVRAEGRAVEILRQDFVLRENPFHLQGAERLDELGAKRARARLGQAHHLHRKRRGAGDLAQVRRIEPRRAQHRCRIHAVVLPEAAVLGGDDRLDDPVVAMRLVDRPAVLVVRPQPDAQRRALAVAQHRRRRIPRQQPARKRTGEPRDNATQHQKKKN